MLKRIFFNDTATTEIYTLSLHDALPIYAVQVVTRHRWLAAAHQRIADTGADARDTRHQHHHPERVSHGPGNLADLLLVEGDAGRSEEHTSELQLRQYLVCRLLLEKKN